MVDMRALPTRCVSINSRTHTQGPLQTNTDPPLVLALTDTVAGQPGAGFTLTWKRMGRSVAPERVGWC